MTEKWTRRLWVHQPGCAAARGEMPATCWCVNGLSSASRVIAYDERGNTTMTRAEVEGLLKLAGYSKENTSG